MEKSKIISEKSEKFKKYIRRLIQSEVREFLPEKTEASLKAKKLGLYHRGFGTYSVKPEGPILFKTRNGKLSRVRDVGKWQRYRAEKDKEKNSTLDIDDIDVDKDIKVNKIKTVSNIRKVGEREYKFKYGEENKRIKFSKKEFEKIVLDHLSIANVIFHKMKDAEKKSKTKLKNPNIRKAAQVLGQGENL